MLKSPTILSIIYLLILRYKISVEQSILEENCILLKIWYPFYNLHLVFKTNCRSLLIGCASFDVKCVLIFRAGNTAFSACQTITVIKNFIIFDQHNRLSVKLLNVHHICNQSQTVFPDQKG